MDLPQDLRTGIDLVNDHRYAEALMLFHDLTIAYPENARVREGYANAYWGLYQYAEAITQFEIALEIDPDNARFYINLSSLHHLLKNEKLAKEFIYKAAATTKNTSARQEAFGYIAQYNNDYEQAVEHFRYALELWATSKGAIISLGGSLLYLKQYEQTEKVMQEGLLFWNLHHEERAYLLAMLGKAQLRSGKEDEGIRNLTNAFELYPAIPSCEELSSGTI
jgi:tetratricopeptide (TPR) repeat protein